MSEPRTIRSIFATPERLVSGLRALRDADITDIEAFGPAVLAAAEPLLPKKGSPVRFVTLAAGLLGCTLGFWLCIGSALLYGKIVGGKPPVSLIPFCIVGFELTILFGGVLTVLAVIGFGRLRPGPLPADYSPGYSCEKFGITVHADEDEAKPVMKLLRTAGAETVHEIGRDD